MHSFRSEDHTGKNRCWPCTVTNLVLAFVIAGFLYLLSPLLAAAFLVVGILLIAFVGYLVPGTPYLTRRYFPKKVMAWFGKAPPETPIPSAEEFETDRDHNADVDRLVTTGALSEAEDGSLVLADSFEEPWNSRIDALRNDAEGQRKAFAEIIGVDPDEITFEPIPETGNFSVRVGENDVSQWMSRAAFVADVAANDTLAAMDPDWAKFSLQDRHPLLMGLRQFLDACPLCEGQLGEKNEATESCCWSVSAITARCEDCGSRLYVIA